MRENVIQTTQREYLDPETGELVTIDYSKTIRRKIKASAFYMTFIDFVAPQHNLKLNAKSILQWMCEHAEFNTGMVSLTTKARENMAKDMNICVNTITNNLATLKKEGLISGEKGEFIINPQIFWKGDIAVRERLLQDKDIQITFKIGEE